MVKKRSEQHMAGRFFYTQTKATCICFSDQRIIHQPCINTEYFYLNIISSPYLGAHSSHLKSQCTRFVSVLQKPSKYETSFSICFTSTRKAAAAAEATERKNCELTHDTFVNVTCNVSVVLIVQTMTKHDRGKWSSTGYGRGGCWRLWLCTGLRVKARDKICRARAQMKQTKGIPQFPHW